MLFNNKLTNIHQHPNLEGMYSCVIQCLQMNQLEEHKGLHNCNKKLVLNRWWGGLNIIKLHLLEQ
jgi:hypothetical protein